MIEIDVVYEGSLRTKCRHEPSATELATDAPRDNHGLGESFSPTDLLATALGSCMMTLMGIHARQRGLHLEGARVNVRKHMVADPSRRVASLVVRFDLPAEINPAERELLEKAARTCPVALSIHPDLELETTFNWGD